jgi:hypothetical protein
LQTTGKKLAQMSTNYKLIDRGESNTFASFYGFLENIFYLGRDGSLS